MVGAGKIAYIESGIRELSPRPPFPFLRGHVGGKSNQVLDLTPSSLTQRCKFQREAVFQTGGPDMQIRPPILAGRRLAQVFCDVEGGRFQRGTGGETWLVHQGEIALAVTGC
jgi:hypothetical protein